MGLENAAKRPLEDEGAFLGGGDADFDRWYREYRRRLEGFCTRLLGDGALAEDVAQEALLRAWLARRRFASEPELRAWLWRVARNLCIDHIRGRARMVPCDPLPEVGDEDGDPAASVVAEAEREEVRSALASLSRRHRELLYLRDVHGIGYDELARRLEVSEVGARSVLHRARRSLREALEAATAALGGLWLPGGGLRGRMAGLFRRATAVGYPSFGLEVAAGVLASMVAMGGLGGSGPAGGQPGVRAAGVRPAAAEERAVLAVSGRPAAEHPSAGHAAPGAATDSARAPLPREGWRGTLNVGGRPDEPDSGLVRLSVGTRREAQSADPDPLSRVPPVSLDALQHPGAP